MTTRFTIVVPTRERCDTLEWALKTCVFQEYDNLEIIVSDNASMDKTEEIVRSFNDQRITYLNTGRRLSMTGNWEFALSHVQGGYVTYLGDDDGLIPGALAEIDRLIRDSDCKAVAWQKAQYTWPTYANPAIANVLYIKPRRDVAVRNATQMLEAVINFRRPYDALPSVYNGFVDFRIMKAAMQNTGRFFYSMIPDIYSALAISCIVGTFCYSYRPYSINGASKHSIGTSYMSLSEDAGRYIASKRFLDENDTSFHHKLVLAPSIPILIAESFFQVKDHMDCCDSLEIDIGKLIKTAVQNAVLQTPAHSRVIIGAAQEIAAIHGLDIDVEAIQREKWGKIQHLYACARPYFALIAAIRLDCEEFSVKNVFDASLLCSNLLVLEQQGYTVRNSSRATLKRLCKAWQRFADPGTTH